MSTRLEVKT